MNRDDVQRIEEFRDVLAAVRPEGWLPGLRGDAEVESLARNLVQSLRRERYPRLLARRPQSMNRADPANELFDPYRGAVALTSAGETEEAFWLLFLATHFGEGGATAWTLLRALYGALGTGRWDWATVSADPDAFATWHDSEAVHIARTGGRFGNHRKRERISSTPTVVSSYVAWVGGRSHYAAVGPPPPSGGDPEALFDAAYSSMSVVHRFGRLGRFDYLSMAGKLALADVRPGHAYLDGSSGPQRGARWLFDGHMGSDRPVNELSKAAGELSQRLGIGFDPLEDALCNWQKHPSEFVPFRH